MNHITNPILQGFNPDPAICRVDDDYYIATSTFEWYPGVQIFHSKNLKDWRLVARPLNRENLLDMRGNPDSCGVWAPCLSYADGLFWLCYTNTRRYDGNFKDTHNYLTTCSSINGQWSDPVYMNSSGFDPSLFHDNDGRKWFVNMVWDHRHQHTPFRGICLQEYSSEQKSLIGPITQITEGSTLGCTEGPHLYHYNDYYYLLLAEGGTGYQHAITCARAKHITGPYVFDPQGPILTAKDNPNHPLQRAGHGGLVETPDGEFYLTHLCSRPLPGTQRSLLGRETAIQKVKLNDQQWFRLSNNTSLPDVDVPALTIDSPTRDEIGLDEFNQPTLNPVWQWLRTPKPKEIMSLKARPGYLRLYGRESIGSYFTQALVARRQTNWSCEASTCVDFQPQNFQQLAGLVCYYNAAKFYYLYISINEQGQRYLDIMACMANLNQTLTYPLGQNHIALPNTGRIYLRVVVEQSQLRFYWRLDNDEWQAIGKHLDASILSDEAGDCCHRHFTGNFIGMACQDLSGQEKEADFSYFELIQP